ncbi:Protein singed wings 2, partial [Operophtera brumata]
MTHVVSDSNGAVIPLITINSIRSIVHNPLYKKLADLYLDNNTISAVKELEGTEWFTSFRIPVYAFDKALQVNNNIMHVFLGHNPWRCDCHFIPRFQGLLRKYKRISTMPLGVVCSSGKEMPISVINIVNL